MQCLQEGKFDVLIGRLKKRKAQLLISMDESPFLI